MKSALLFLATLGTVRAGFWDANGQLLDVDYGNRYLNDTTLLLEKINWGIPDPQAGDHLTLSGVFVNKVFGVGALLKTWTTDEPPASVLNTKALAVLSGAQFGPVNLLIGFLFNQWASGNALTNTTAPNNFKGTIHNLNVSDFLTRYNNSAAFNDNFRKCLFDYIYGVQSFPVGLSKVLFSTYRGYDVTVVELTATVGQLLGAGRRFYPIKEYSLDDLHVTGVTWTPWLEYHFPTATTMLVSNGTFFFG